MYNAWGPGVSPATFDWIRLYHILFYVLWYQYDYGDTLHMAIKLYQYIKHCIVTRSICRAMILFMTCKISSYHKWDRHLVMHIYEKWVSISSGSYLLPVQHQPTTWPSADIMSIGPLGMYLPEFSSCYLIAIFFWRESHLCIVNIKASEAKTFLAQAYFHQ